MSESSISKLPKFTGIIAVATVARMPNGKDIGLFAENYDLLSKAWAILACSKPTKFRKGPCRTVVVIPTKKFVPATTSNKGDT